MLSHRQITNLQAIRRIVARQFCVIPVHIGAESDAKVQPTSKRQQFRSINPDPRVMTRLDHMELGYLPNRRARIALTKRLGDTRAGGVRHSQKPKEIDLDNAPFPFQSRGVPIGKAKSISKFPFFRGDPPEIALIGRSNVGKSTLLNALVGYDTSFVQKAEVSPRPGETKALQFFGIGVDKRKTEIAPKLVLVDFPGYGFSFLNDEESKRCADICSEYLLGNRKNLKRVLLLLDARHGFKIGDKDYFRKLMYGASNDAEDPQERKKSMKEIRAGINWKLQIVLTKCDLLERVNIARRIEVIQQEITDALPGLSNMLPIMTVSGKERKGIHELQRELAGLVSSDNIPTQAPKTLQSLNNPERTTQVITSTRDEARNINTRTSSPRKYTNRSSEFRSSPVSRPRGKSDDVQAPKKKFVSTSSRSGASKERQSPVGPATKTVAVPRATFKQPDSNSRERKFFRRDK